MDEKTVDTHQKALSINLDPTKYGTIAEIGAGQEIAGWLFRVGGASGTVAKTMSAYDMKFSDAIYGKAGRYVSKERLTQMLNHEYKLLLERLSETRKSDTTFFVLANTISARNYKGTNVSHGWLGIRFQTEPDTEPNDFLIHVNLLDDSNLLQQRAVGVLGINLLYATFTSLKDNPKKALKSLVDDLRSVRVEVDYVSLRGPDFRKICSRSLGINLLKNGLSSAVMFSPDKLLVPPAEVMYKCPVIIQRGSFRRESDFHEEMLASGMEQLIAECEGKCKRHPVAMFEMTINNLLVDKMPSSADLLERIDRLTDKGRYVMATSFAENYHLTHYISRYTKEPIRFALGVASLVQVFQERYYESLAGGILEALGRLVVSNVKMYVFPMPINEVLLYLTASNLDLSFWEMPLTGDANLENVKPVSDLRHLYDYLYDINALVSMTESAVASSSKD